MQYRLYVMSRRGCGCCGRCDFCDCFCNPDNPNLRDGEVCSEHGFDPQPSQSERSALFDLYDFTMLICNSNSAKDDEFEIKLNGYDLGNVSELGEDVCKGKFFTTNEDMLERIRKDAFNDNSPSVNLNSDLYCEHTPLCCMRNTFDLSEYKSVDRQAFNFCGDNPIQFKRTKANFNGNFGRILIYRMGPSESHIDHYSSLFSPDQHCETSEREDSDGNVQRHVNKSTRICTVHAGTYLIPSVYDYIDSAGGRELDPESGVGISYSPTVSQRCCFCNHHVKDTILDYRYGG